MIVGNRDFNNRVLGNNDDFHDGVINKLIFFFFIIRLIDLYMYI